MRRKGQRSIKKGQCQIKVALKDEVHLLGGCFRVRLPAMALPVAQ